MLVTPIWRATEDVDWLQMSWEISGNHYAGNTTPPGATGYEFTTPRTFLCYYVVLRLGLSERFLPPASMASSPVPSGPYRGCIGSTLCLIRSFTWGMASWTSSAQSLSTVFAGLVTSCDNLITTLPESFTSSTDRLKTGNDLVGDHTLKGHHLPGTPAD